VKTVPIRIDDIDPTVTDLTNTGTAGSNPLGGKHLYLRVPVSSVAFMWSSNPKTEYTTQEKSKSFRVNSCRKRSEVPPRSN